VPVSPNKIGSKIIQNISNAVATGFWKTFTIHIVRKEKRKQSSETHWSLSVPPPLTPKSKYLQKRVYLHVPQISQDKLLIISVKSSKVLKTNCINCVAKHTAVLLLFYYMAENGKKE